MIKIFLVCLFFMSPPLFSKVILNSQSEGVAYKVELLASGFDVIWSMDFIDQQMLIFTEKSGKISLLNTKTLQTTPLSGLAKDMLILGQGGLMDVKVKDAWIYFTYVKDIDGKGATTLARAKLKGLQLINWQDLHVSKSVSDTGRHFGSRITFDEEGYLFYSIGDRGVRANGQDTNTHAGSILRLHVDGKVPKDNPFVGKEGLNEIYSFGHRNPQGLFYDKVTQKLYSIEHGPRGGDEINLIKKGANYGWATISHGQEYWGDKAVGEGTYKKGMEDALKVFIPSIAPSSLIVYNGNAFPKWRGSLLSGALKLTHLNRIVLDQNGKVIKEERLLETLKLRIRDVKESVEGYLYISTDNGYILRLSPR
jgi:glucose/arabinose dehydrogenase